MSNEENFWLIVQEFNKEDIPSSSKRQKPDARILMLRTYPGPQRKQGNSSLLGNGRQAQTKNLQLPRSRVLRLRT